MRAPLGILMLETRFPRLPGDIGNAASFEVPVLYETVRAATVARIVAAQPDPALLEPFVAAGRRLTARGAALIATSCGFLVLWQQLLAERLQVPVLSSALLMLPWLDACLPSGRRAGVITFDAAALGARHFAAAGARADTPVAGLAQDGALVRAIRADAAEIDPGAARAELFEAAEQLLARHPEVAALVLECTNLGPWKDDLAERLRCPVFGIVGALEWFCRSLPERRARSEFT